MKVVRPCVIINKMEVELKLLFAEEELHKFLQGKFFLDHCCDGEGETLRLVSTYYDSPERRLRRDGVAYRVRSTEFPDGHVEYESTTKRTIRKEGGLAEREEINEPQMDGSPRFADVEPLFATKVTRVVRMLRYEGALFEMAVDKGWLEAANGRTESIDEVEFELKEGTAGDLENLRRALARVAVFREESKSKYARGLALLGEV